MDMTDGHKPSGDIFFIPPCCRVSTFQGMRSEPRMNAPSKIGGSPAHYSRHVGSNDLLSYRAKWEAVKGFGQREFLGVANMLNFANDPVSRMACAV